MIKSDNTEFLCLEFLKSSSTDLKFNFTIHTYVLIGSVYDFYKLTLSTISENLVANRYD